MVVAAMVLDVVLAAALDAAFVVMAAAAVYVTMMMEEWRRWCCGSLLCLCFLLPICPAKGSTGTLPKVTFLHLFMSSLARLAKSCAKNKCF